MAPIMCTMSASPLSATSFRCRAPPAAAAAPQVRPRLFLRTTVLVRNTPSEEGVKSEKDPFEVPQTGRTAPMSEDKRADTPEQMAAPEGDRAIKGQAWQPTEQDGETPEDRFGSKEAAKEAAEEHKDKSKKSELQTGDMEGQWGEGGA